MERLYIGDSAELICPRAGIGREAGSPLVTPIVQSTTFCSDRIGAATPHQYSRVSNPTVSVLETELGRLEDAPAAACFSTGLAAETALFLALLRAGDHAVCGRAVYGGTSRLLRRVLAGLGIETTFVDATRAEDVRAAVRPRTRLVFVETPSNPTLELTDIRAIAAVAASSGVVLAVDNTFLTGVLQRPLDLGAHVSVYSTTKFIDGHSAALGGAIVTRDAAILEQVRFIRKCTGAIQTPFNAFLTLQGLKTLPLRIQRQSQTADAIATWLAGRRGVVRVHYPSHTDCRRTRAIARAQHLGADGAVLSFEVPDARSFVTRLSLCRLVEHVGSVETLITHPATMTHADVPPDERRALGISDDLVRLSVGLEPAPAIIADLDRALTPASQTTPANHEEVLCATTL